MIETPVFDFMMRWLMEFGTEWVNQAKVKAFITDPANGMWKSHRFEEEDWDWNEGYKCRGFNLLEVEHRRRITQGYPRRRITKEAIELIKQGNKK